MKGCFSGTVKKQSKKQFHGEEKTGNKQSTFSKQTVLDPHLKKMSQTSHGNKEDERKIRISKPLAYVSEDLKRYRNGYPDIKDDFKKMTSNWEFYTNKLESRPEGANIDTIHEKWWGDYYLLERHHGYIQWLFPLREPGMNFHAKELQLHEMKAIKNDKPAKNRVLKSFEMMLHFYGMKLIKPEVNSMETDDSGINVIHGNHTVAVCSGDEKQSAQNSVEAQLTTVDDKAHDDRTDPHLPPVETTKGQKQASQGVSNRGVFRIERAENYRERYAHLNRSRHNYLRITRILKSLGELGWEHLKPIFVRFVLEEIFFKKELENTLESCVHYWLETIRDKDARRQLKIFVEEHCDYVERL